MTIGDHVRKADGRFGVVKALKLVVRAQRMYNLTVHVAHTFFVGTARWLVHNSCWRVYNHLGELYPSITDVKTGNPIPFPDNAPTQPVPQANRVSWGNIERGAFIKEWLDRNYPTPPGGWGNYDIHHILPREFGGTNDFSNLTPVVRGTHPQFTNWWNNYP